MSQWWSWTLTAVGITGFLLTSRGRWGVGWSLNIAVQVLWFTYAIVSRQWGFIVSACVYSVVFSLNLRREMNRANAGHDAARSARDSALAEGAERLGSAGCPDAR